MDNIEISLYQSLIGNTIISEKLKEVEEKEKQLKQVKQELELSIKKIQDSCGHKNCKENWVHYENLRRSSFSRGMNVLESKTCTECGHVILRPKGRSEEICHVCWSPMRFEGRTPGQEGDGYCIYICTNQKCNSEIWST